MSVSISAAQLAIALSMALLLVAPLPAVGPAQAQDAMTDRYRAIRAPTEALANQTRRQRLQSELNALEREESRVRNTLRNTRRLLFADPISALPSEERAQRARLDRIDADRQAVGARLQQVPKPTRNAPVPARVTNGLSTPYALPPGNASRLEQSVSPEEAVAAARAYVDALLQSNRARP